MSGTFEIDGELFPVDPIKKRWSPVRSSTYGTAAPGIQNIRGLTLQFPTMEMNGQSSFFQAKFMQGGLHTIKVVDPHHGGLTTFTGVTIENYQFTIPQNDNQYWAQSPNLSLSINILATGTA